MKSKCQKLIDDKGPELTKLLIQRAEDGSFPALKMCIERLIAPKKSLKANIQISGEDLSNIDRIKDVALQSLVKAANGEMENEQASSISRLIDTYVNIDLTPDSLYARLEKAKAILPDSGNKK